MSADEPMQIRSSPALSSARATARAAARALSSGASSHSLAGHTAWVVGGAGPIGQGIAHGLLRAGATVVVNSRFQNRLAALSAELGNPENLITVHGSLMAGDAERTVNDALELTGGSLAHVVAHSAVRWWAPSQAADESSTLASKSLLALGADDFAVHATQLPSLHFSAISSLLPRLHPPASGGSTSYTFVTGGADGTVGSGVAPLAQLNAHAVWGLAAALRTELANDPLRVGELRVNLRFNRPATERAADPRETPLTHDIGAICAGVAASADEAGYLELNTQFEVTGLRDRFPARDMPYPVYFRMNSFGGI